MGSRLMGKGTLIAIGGGGLSAAASLAFSTGVPGALMFVYLAPLPVFLVGFSTGTLAGIIAGASGFLFAGLMGGAVAAGLYGLIHALPSFLVIRQSLLQRTNADGTTQWYSAGSTLSYLSMLGASIITLAAVFFLSSGDGMQAAVADYLDSAFRIMVPALSDSARSEVVTLLAPLFPGAVGMSWVVMTALNGILAQAILVPLGRNLRPSPVFTELELPHWNAWILVAAAGLALLGGGEIEYMGRNLAVIMAVPYFFLGLAIVHALVKQLPYSGLFLTAFYLVLLISGLTAYPVVAGVGVIEQWFGLRRRIAGTSASEENE